MTLMDEVACALLDPRWDGICESDILMFLANCVFDPDVVRYYIANDIDPREAGQMELFEDWEHE